MTSISPPAPPLPERPSSSYQNVTSNSPYGALGYRNGGFGQYPNSMYGGYNSYGSNYPFQGYQNPYTSSYGGAMNSSAPSPRFVRLAEENTRPAFETIQSIVQSFNSISMMFESTYFALHSSFRAVLSVIEHFSRVKVQFSQILSAFALVRYLKILYRKLLELAGFIQPERNTPSVLEQVPTEEMELSQNKNMDWPIILFSGMTILAPYLMWKLISSFESKDEQNGNDNQDWLKGKEDYFVAMAEFDFKTDRKEEIPLQVGQEVMIAPKHRQPKIRGWILGSVDGKISGLLPANYVKIIGKKLAPEINKPDLITDFNPEDKQSNENN